MKARSSNHALAPLQVLTPEQNQRRVMLRQLLLPTAAAVCASSWSRAALAQTQVPPSNEPPTGEPSPVPGLRWSGQGLLRVWGFEVYRARLWVGPRFNPADHASDALALELEYLRAFSAASIASRSIEEMRRQQHIAPDQGERWQRALQAVLPDVRAGDRLLGVYRPGQAAQFRQPNRVLGEVPDALFARLFFGIWLAPTTSEPGLRAALLGLPARG
ncbi:MAG: chalcone isomerase family protein [Pseudomonadota bacterium]|jgi:hypothetical protein